MPAAMAAKAQNGWSITQRIIYVGLTPDDQPDFWTQGEGETTTATGEELRRVQRGAVAVLGAAAAGIRALPDHWPLQWLHPSATDPR